MEKALKQFVGGLEQYLSGQEQLLLELELELLIEVPGSVPSIHKEALVTGDSACCNSSSVKFNYLFLPP